MKKPMAMAVFLLFCAALPPAFTWADTPTDPMATPAAFKPHWGFELGLNSSGTPGDNGGGGAANDLSFTATRELSDSGSFFSLSAMGGSQKVEGYTAKYGSLSANGGLGLGFFQPSLSLSAQTGEESLFATTAGLNLGFQIFDDISIGVNFTGGFSSHKTPLPLLLPGAPDVEVEVDGKNWGGGLSFIWATSEIFSLTLSGQNSNEITYQLKFKGPKVDLTVPLNQSSVIPSTSLGFNWAFVKDFALNGSVQRSAEFEPAGTSYSPSLGEVVNNDTATTLYFSGYSIGLTFNFE